MKVWRTTTMERAKDIKTLTLSNFCTNTLVRRIQLIDTNSPVDLDRQSSRKTVFTTFVCLNEVA